MDCVQSWILVLLGRICADNEDFEDSLAQPDYYLPSHLKRKQNKKSRSRIKVHPIPRRFYEGRERQRN